jgi:hypothetical protein
MAEINTKQVKLPFGSGRVRGSSTMTPQITEAFKFLSRFEYVDFKINRVTEKLVDVRFMFKNVPTAQGGEMDYTEDFRLMVGDIVRLQYGEGLILQKIEPTGITVIFEKEYDEKRLEVK